MDLLDLPPELFQHIISDLVSAGIREAWRLRSVSRKYAENSEQLELMVAGNFAAQVAREIFAYQPKEHLMLVENAVS